ncbi:MAG: hypothetical protein FWH55_05265 [Oscillospiraceae bacterium]|nr:hypothetical protein [Oscillospiraceae bacterium]
MKKYFRLIALMLAVVMCSGILTVGAVDEIPADDPDVVEAVEEVNVDEEPVIEEEIDVPVAIEEEEVEEEEVEEEIEDVAEEAVLAAFASLDNAEFSFSDLGETRTVSIEGEGIYVEVNRNTSLSIYRVEEDGSLTPMTEAIEPIVPTGLDAATQTAWAGRLPWSVGAGTGNTTLHNNSAKLLSAKSGYLTTGTRSTGGVAGNETAIEDFVLIGSEYEEDVEGYFGEGDRLTIVGESAAIDLTRIVVIETSYRNPGVVSVTTKYRYNSAGSLSIARFVENNFKIHDPLPASRYIANKREAGLWTQQGSTLVWGMDYVMPMYNTMGTRASTTMDAPRCANNDLVSRNNWFWGENGGIPFNLFWGENVGVLIGSAMPTMVRSMEIPTRGSAITGEHDTAYTWVGFPGKTLQSGVLTEIGTSIVGVYSGDNYTGSKMYEQAMSWISNIEINGYELPSDYFASPDPANYPEDAWLGTWESWGGSEGFNPIAAIRYANNGVFQKLGIKYIILDAAWYPRGTNTSNASPGGGAYNYQTAQAGGEGYYRVIPGKWADVATYFNLPNTTFEETKAVVRAWNDFMHEKGLKTAAWCMPESVFLHAGSDTGWSSAASGSGATISGRNIQIDTPFTDEHPDYLITANAAEYDPLTGALLPGQTGSNRPWYRRQSGYYPQNGTAELCLGNPRVLEEYTDYFCNLMFAEYGFDGLKIDTQWGTSQCFAIGHGHDGNPNASIENFSMYWKTIYDKAKEILGEDPWIKHCQCGTMMGFFTQPGTNRPITGDPGSSNVRKARYSIRMWKGLYGDNATAVSDHVENFGSRCKSLMAAGYIMESKFYNVNGNDPSATILKYFPIAAEEGLSKGKYLDLYKFGFDYPEVLAYDRSDKDTRYYSIFASSAPVSSFTGGSAYAGGGETSMNYTGPAELRGLTPGVEYTISNYDYDDTNFAPVTLVADSAGIITIDVNFTEVLPLKVEWEGCAHDGDTYDVVTLEPTCEEPGLKDVYCAICGALLEADVVIPALGHSYVAVSATVSNTNLQNNTTVTITVKCVCSVCGAETTIAQSVKLKSNGTQTVQVGGYTVTVVVNGNNKITDVYAGAPTSSGNNGNSQGNNKGNQNQQ